MTIKVVSYDLGGPESSDSYRRLTGAIHQIGDSIKPLESFFLLSTPLTCDEVRKHLAARLDNNDKLIVIETNECVAAWSGADKETYNWIMSHR